MLTQTGMLPPHGFSNTCVICLPKQACCLHMVSVTHSTPFPPSLISLTVSGGIKHHVYLLTSATLVSSAYPDTIVSGGIKHHVYLLTSATPVSSAYPDTIVSGGIKHHVYLLTSATLVSSAYPDTIAVTSVLTCIFWQLSCWKHQSLPSPQCQPPPPPSALSKLFHKNAKKKPVSLFSLTLLWPWR